VTFARRGFRGGAGGARERIESIGRAFLTGYAADTLAHEETLILTNREMR
jgi:hypothetical protein